MRYYGTILISGPVVIHSECIAAIPEFAVCCVVYLHQKRKMMNTKTKFGMLIASVALAASGAVCAADAPANPYVQQPAKH